MLAIYKSFIRPHLDITYITCPTSYPISYMTKHITELNLKENSIQFSARNNRSWKRNFQRKTLPRVRIRISRKKEDSIKNPVFYKILKKQSPKYLLNIILLSRKSYCTRHAGNVPSFKVRHFLIFFSSTVIE